MLRKKRKAQGKNNATCYVKPSKETDNIDTDTDGWIPINGHLYLLVQYFFLHLFHFCSRPHAKEGKKKKKRRICWEYYHKIMGVAGILIGFIQITLGVFLIISPLGVWITWICMMFLWFAIFAIHELLKWIRTCSSSKESEDEEHELKEKR